MDQMISVLSNDSKVFDLYVDTLNIYDIVEEIINYKIDQDLTYTSDFWEILKEYTTPSDLFNGLYTIDNLVEDMRDDMNMHDVVVELLENIDVEAEELRAFFIDNEIL